MTREPLPSSDRPLISRRPLLLMLVGCAIGFLGSIVLFFLGSKRTTGLWPLYVAVCFGIGTSVLLTAGALSSRHRLAQAGAGIVLGLAVLYGGLVLFTSANVGGFSGGK